jgi:cell division protein FtsQ
MTLVRPLALVPPRSVQLGAAVPWRRVAAAAGAVLVVLVLLYVGARSTSVFAVRTIAVSGAPAEVRGEVRAAARSFEGKSLVGLDGEALVRQLEALPSVESATYDRAFPGTLRIFIYPEAPVAVMEVGTEAWVVSERGRIIRRAGDGAGRLPHFQLEQAISATAGSFVTDPGARLVLGALARLPRGFPARVKAVHLERGALSLDLETGWGTPELRLGPAVDVAPKLAAAGLVLRHIPAPDRASVGYVDVSLPQRVVVGPKEDANSQPEG